MRARSALFTLFGDVIRPTGGEAWLTTLTACMGALGFTPEATRTALHRMTSEGWVEPRRVGRYAAYRLTPRGVDRLEEAAARIFRLRAAAWDGRWRLLLDGSIARGGELDRALRWMGFGRLSAETWVSPHDHGQRLTALLAEHAIGDPTTFVTDPDDSDPARDRRIVDTAWDLSALRAAHAAFIERWQRATLPADPRAAFAVRARLVHDWRGFLHLDPGLPERLLPDDWLGDSATARFQRAYATLEEPSWRFYEEARAADPQPAAASAAAAPTSP